MRKRYLISILVVLGVIAVFAAILWGGNLGFNFANSKASLLSTTSAPETPRGFDAGTTNIDDLVISWINPSDADLDHINLYWWRSTAGFDGVPFDEIAASPNTKGERIISNIAADGTEYKIMLEAVDASGNVSERTSTLKRTSSSIVDTASPGPATSVAAVDNETGGQLNVTWTNPPDDDFFHMRVYRSTYAGFAPTADKEIVQIFGNPSEPSQYNDTGLTDGVAYHYVLRSEDVRGNLYTTILEYPRASATPTKSEAPAPPSEQTPPDDGAEPQSGPDLSDIADGDLLKTADNPDVYIVKRIGAKNFKRLILNPDIFNSYGHLEWGNVKTVEQAVVDAFTPSELVQEINADGSIADPKVYILTSEPNTDIGLKRWLNVTAVEFEQLGYDWDARFFINHTEAGEAFYPQGDPITAS